MTALQTLRDALPDWAKDIRLNLDAVIERSSLPSAEALGCALAAAFAARSPVLVAALRQRLETKDAEAALTAAALMGMNNVWYPFVEMAEDEALKTLRPELRMNAYASHGGVPKRQFEACALAASIVGKCHYCVRSHYALLQQEGMSTQQLRDVGRIAAVVHAAAAALAAAAPAAPQP
jgi:alkyl hydroperoxide reductase subunit D